jgi:hypothetical protein
VKKKGGYCCSGNSYHIAEENLCGRIFSIRMKDFIFEVTCDPTKFHLQQRERDFVVRWPSLKQKKNTEHAITKVIWGIVTCITRRGVYFQ